MARYDEANATRDAGLKRLETSYLGVLKRHMEKVKGSGDLSRVLPVRDEIEAVETGADPLPALPDTAGRDLKKMREKYAEARVKVRKTHAETLVDLADKMDEALKKTEADLTKAGKIDDALSAQRMRETLAEDRGISAARKLLDAGGGEGGVRLGEWLPLLEENMDVVNQGSEPVGRLSDLIRDLGDSVVKRLAGGTGIEPAKVLVSPSPARVRFKPSQGVSRIRGRVALVVPQGDVICRIFAGGEKQFEQRLNREGLSDKFDLEFPPSRLIELEVDENGHTGNDRVIWTDLEVR